MDKFGLIEGTLLRAKELVTSGTLPPGLFDEFVEACLTGYVDDLDDRQLSVLFRMLNQIELLLTERGLAIASVTGARETLLFVLENNRR